jgi:hypothetical protein
MNRSQFGNFQLFYVWVISACSTLSLGLAPVQRQEVLDNALTIADRSDERCQEAKLYRLENLL